MVSLSIRRRTLALMLLFTSTSHSTSASASFLGPQAASSSAEPNGGAEKRKRKRTSQSEVFEELRKHRNSILATVNEARKQHQLSEDWQHVKKTADKHGKRMEDRQQSELIKVREACWFLELDYKELTKKIRSNLEGGATEQAAAEAYNAQEVARLAYLEAVSKWNQDKIKDPERPQVKCDDGNEKAQTDAFNAMAQRINHVHASELLHAKKLEQAVRITIQAEKELGDFFNSAINNFRYCSDCASNYAPGLDFCSCSAALREIILGGRPELEVQVHCPEDEKLKDDLACPICVVNTFGKDPTMTHCCGKSICEQCAKILEPCPYCRRKPFHEVPDLALRDRIKKARITKKCSTCKTILDGREEAAAHSELNCPGVQVACGWRRYGGSCKWTGRRDEYASHALSCDCGRDICGRQLHSDLSAHGRRGVHLDDYGNPPRDWEPGSFTHHGDAAYYHLRGQNWIASTCVAKGRSLIRQYFELCAKYDLDIQENDRLSRLNRRFPLFRYWNGSEFGHVYFPVNRDVDCPLDRNFNEKLE